MGLFEIFPTLDRETVQAVFIHQGGDTLAAMMQLIELLGEDEEALECALALLQAEDFEETAQLAHDEQVARALQEEFANSESSSAVAPESASTEAPVVRRRNKFASDARELLIKLGRQRARTSTQRLLDPSVEGSDAVQDDAERVPYAPPSPPSSLVEDGSDNSKSSPRDAKDGRDELYNARLMRARASRRPSMSNREDPQSVMTIA